MRVRIVAGNAVLAIDGERIGDPDDLSAATIEAGAGEFHPGLINAHDHLHRNHYARIGSPPYPNAYAWGDDLHTRFAGELARAATLPRETALLFGALKNLLGGVTTVVHHDRFESAFSNGFPLRVPRVRVAHSLRLDPDLHSVIADSTFAPGPFALHLAEGTDAIAAEEVREADGLGILRPGLLAVHVVGADADGVHRLRRSGTAIVWCPTSNAFLFGQTAPAALLEPNTDVLLGTDALLTGAGTLLDELRSARRLGLIADQRLLDAVGSVAAQRLGLPTPSLAPGSPADVILLRRPFLEARSRDVALVMVSGNPRLADAALGEIFELAAVPCEPLTVGGESKLVASPLACAAQEVFNLQPECARIIE